MTGRVKASTNAITNAKRTDVMINERVQTNRSGSWQCWWLAIFVFEILTSTDAIAKAPPTCGGRHMLEDIKTQDPESYQRIRSAADATINARNILWRIEKDGVAPSYLFGTAHVTDPRLNQLSKPTILLIQSARLVLLELPDEDPAKFARLFETMPEQFFAAEGDTVKSTLSPDEFATLMKRIGEPDQSAVFQPWFYTALLATPSCEGARVEAGLHTVDETVAKLAKRKKIQVRGLETSASQVRAMAAIPKSDQIEHLKSAIRLSDKAADQHETLNRLYLDRDLAAIWPLSVELATKSGVAATAFDSFEKSLIVDRNQNLVDASLPDVAKGNAFIAVGALHLLGSKGLVELLRQAGYRLVPIE
jgi:uncharacterized protein